MKVKTIQVKNLRQIDEIKADFNGCTAIVTGGNNKGKSTLLKSIIERLRGNKANIIKEGKETGECERTFTDGSTLSWELNGEKEKINYITSQGIKTSAIRDICNMLFGKGFDIDDFLQSPPKKQQEIMKGLVGINTTKLDEKYQLAYQKRTETKAIYNAEKAKVSDFEIIKVEGEYKDISLLQENLIESEKKNEQVKSIESKMKDKEKRITQIQEEIKRLQDEEKVVLDDINKGKDRLSKTKITDTTKLREEIEIQKNVNILHENNKKVSEMNNLLAMLERNVDECEKEVKSISKEKDDLIRSANMPEGFSFSDEGLLFNGYPLDKSNLSSSQIYIAGLILASMNIGDVRTLTFDASYLDRNSLEDIERWANNNDLQLLIERPDFDGGDIKYEIVQENKNLQIK